MKRYTEKYLKGVLKKYPYENEIKTRTEKIYNPDSHYLDENFGYSFSNIKKSPVELAATKIADDYNLNIYKEYRDAIDKVMSGIDEKGKEIISMRFFESKSINEVSANLNVSLAIVRKYGSDFLEDLASELQLMR